MSSLPAGAPKPKKSVALSGVPAGNTALCTVGRSGNDLHYRGYDILDFADEAEFEEVAHLLVHEKLPTAAELAAYKAKLKGLRGLPQAVRAALEAVPASAHPMDVMRTGVSAFGTLEPDNDDHPPDRPQARGGERVRFRSLVALLRSRRGRGRHHAQAAGQGDRHRLRPPRLHDGRSAQQGDQGSRPAPLESRRGHEALRHRRTHRAGDVAGKEDVRQSGLV